MRKALCMYRGTLVLTAVVMTAVFWMGTAQATVVTFPDPNLDAAVRIAIGKPSGRIDHTELVNVGFTSLNASYRGITNLAGIEWCKDLTTLQLYGNEISDISRLSNLTKLVDLYLWDNEIIDITALEGLTKLRFVFLHNNHITDISCLENNTSWNSGDIVNLSGNYIDQNGLCNVVPEMEWRGVLVYLDDTAVCNQIRVSIPDPKLEEQLRWALDMRDEEIHPYIYDTDLATLTEFVANARGIVELTGLEYCVNLRTLNLEGNEIDDLAPLRGLALMKSLMLAGNNLEDLTPLRELYSLQELGLQENKIADLSPLATLGSLEKLYLSENLITDISKLQWLLHLQILTLESNQITSIAPLSRLKSLMSLRFSGNQVSDLTALQPLLELRELSFADNAVTIIDPIEPLYRLYYLDASFNTIVDISVLATLTNLEQVYLHDNKIRVISVLAGLPELSVATLANNEISDISALVANTSLGDEYYGTSYIPPFRDMVDVSGNLLSQENICNDIPALRLRDVIVKTDENQVCDIFGASYTLTMAVATPGSGTVDPPEGSRRYVGGTDIKLRATPAVGYEFSRWTGDFESTDNPATVNMDSDKRITAVFSEMSVKFTLTVEAVGQGSVSPAVGTHQYGSQSQVELIATPAKDWVFDRWEGDLTGTINKQRITMDGNKTVRAVFKQQGALQAVRIYVRGSGTTQPAPGTAYKYPMGDHVAIKAIPNLGYKFDHWEGDLTSRNAEVVLEITGPQSVTAVFVPDGYDYTLAMVSVVGGTSSPAAGFHRYYEGAVVTVSAVPEEDYVFEYWKGSVNNVTSNPLTITMDSDKTIEPVFLYAPVQYGLSIGAMPGGTTSPGPGSYLYAEGKKITVTAIPQQGYVFDRWEGDLGGSKNPELLTMDGNKAVQAFFKPYPFLSGVAPVQGSTSGNETVTISGGRLLETTEVWFDDQQATIVSKSADELTVKTPSHERGVSSITAVTLEGETNTLVAAFTFIEPPGPPTFGQVNPANGTVAGGDTLLIRGQNLQLTRQVLFGGQAAAIVSSTESRLTVVTPPHAAGVVDIAITTTTGAVTGTGAYTYVPAPQATGVEPGQGHVSGGEAVTITGAELDTTYSVTFDGIPVQQISAVTSTQIVVLAPAHQAGTVDILVLTRGGAVLLESAYNYYSVGATIVCQVADGKDLLPITDAEVRLDSGALISGSTDGTYTFTGLRPGTYEVTIVTSECGEQTRTITVLANEQATLNFVLECEKSTTPQCGSAVKRLDTRIAESTLPMSVQDAPAGSVKAGTTLAVRLGGNGPIDPLSAWAYAEAEGWSGTGGTWRAQTVESQDGWVVYEPAEPLPAGKLLTLTVGASSMDGEPVGPVSYEFAVSSAGEVVETPGLVEAAGIPELPSMLAAPKSQVWRIGPSQVFSEPTTVQIPLPDGTPEDADIYYYSESIKHKGWYPAQNVVGFIEPDSRGVIEQDGQRYIQLRVNHGGIVQLGQTVKLSLGNSASLEIGWSGQPKAWALLLATVAVLATALRAVVRKTPNA